MNGPIALGATAASCALFLLIPVSAQTNSTLDVIAGPTSSDFVFEPEEITIAPGTMVRWTNGANVTHTITSTASLQFGEITPDGRFDGTVRKKGETFSHTFSEPGAYRYFCQPHIGLEMFGTIVVEGDVPDKDTPAPGLIAGLVAAAAALAWSRRREEP